MMPFSAKIARCAVAVLLLFLALVLSAAAQSQEEKNGSTKSRAAEPAERPTGVQAWLKGFGPAAADPSQYAGTETCKSCHEDEGASYDSSPHSKMPVPAGHKGPGWQGCEACHGPGQEHAESGDPAKIVRFPALSWEESSRRCLKCHAFGREHASFLQSEHGRNKVGCLACHSMHAARDKAKLLKTPQPQLCYSCHKEVRPGSAKSFHPRVTGEAECTECHNPHGGPVTRQPPQPDSRGKLRENREDIADIHLVYVQHRRSRLEVSGLIGKTGPRFHVYNEKPNSGRGRPGVSRQ